MHHNHFKTVTGLGQYDIHDPEQRSPTRAVANVSYSAPTDAQQRPPSRSYERSSPPRSSSRNELNAYERGLGEPAPGNQYSEEQPTERGRVSPTKGRVLSRQKSPQKQLSSQQSEQDVVATRRGNETGAGLMEQQQQPLYDHRDETSPMEAALYGSAETGRGDDAYQYEPTFANYDLDQSQNYSTDGAIQYGDQQQPLYEGDQYAGPAGGEFYQPQQQSTNAYLDNDGQQQYQPKYDVQGDYKYQPEPEYEYKPYQGGQQRPPEPNPPVVPATPPPAAQQSKPSYTSPPQSTGQQPPRTTAPAEQRGPVRSTTGAAKSTRVLPQSRAPAASAAASLSDRK